jgi:hypothetical protein
MFEDPHDHIRYIMAIVGLPVIAGRKDITPLTCGSLIWTKPKGTNVDCSPGVECTVKTLEMNECGDFVEQRC